MNAIEFVKKYGIDHAKYVLRANVDVPIMHGDLKQIVEAWELVESYGGLKGAKNWINNVVINESMSNIQAVNSDLSKAINLVEQCQ